MFCLFGTCCLWVEVLLHQNICFTHEVLISISWHVALRDNNLLLNNCLKMCHLSSCHYPSTSSMTSVNHSHQSARCIPPISEYKTLELHIAEFCHDVLQIPTDVDHWLTANLWYGQNVCFLADYLKFGDVNNSSVMCKVERVIVQICKLKSTPLQLSNNLFSYQHPTHPLTHTLFITAAAKTTKCLPLKVWASPRAVLDRYQGDVKMLNSPDWVWSEKTQYIFAQLWMSSVNLFAKLACHNFNSNQVWLDCVSLTGILNNFFFQMLIAGTWSSYDGMGLLYHCESSICVYN